MPLVRIATKGKAQKSARTIGAVTARTIIDVLYVPGKPTMQVITEYSADPISYVSSDGETDRDDLAAIEIALADGRDVALKNRFYKTLLERLTRETGMRAQDIYVNLVEIKVENWAWRNT